ncbi:energy transducer TonB [Novosphingobium sp. CF614]|uniref:energy transducer TonB family protein n=1 Tax=Novosphingobium sp. CF614 TaxID=1884364 RepID=UPI003515BFCE
MISSTLSAGLLLLVLLIAIYQTQLASLPEKRSKPVTFDIAGDDTKAGAKAEQKHKAAKKRDTKQPRQDRAPVETPVPPTEKPAPAEKPAFTFHKLSRADMAAADIGGMTRSGGGDAASGKAAYGPGEGPGGAVLYNADWFKEPTDAQLGGYLPANIPRQGWGMIACQTLEHYRVDNCQILGESPRGSGFGRAVLDAAWQFQVVPPRINGKPQLGVWVRIRIDYGTKKAEG